MTRKKRRALLCMLAVPLLALAPRSEESLPASAAEPAAVPEKYVALTFDDGPWPETTEQLLDGLAERGAKATFFARTVDADVELTKSCLLAAARHQGMSVVECLVNCVIFNNKTHADFAGDKATRAERTIVLRHGEKMLFGTNRDKGLVRENGKLKAVTVGEDGYTIDDVLTHDAHERDTSLHLMLAAMKYPDMPVAVGVIREVEDTHVYDRKVAEQVAEVRNSNPIRCMDDLLHAGETWEIG